MEADTLDRAHAVAETLNISLTAYLEELIRNDQLDEHGRPVWWPHPVPADQEELPLTQSA